MFLGVFDDIAVGDAAPAEHFDAGTDLADDGARIAADEGVAADVFAALDRFEEERFAVAAKFAIGGERRLKSASSRRVTGMQFPCFANCTNSSRDGESIMGAQISDAKRRGNAESNGFRCGVSDGGRGW